MPAAIVTFRTEGRLWAVDVKEVLEIIRAGAVTPVPGTARRLAGVVGWRGKTLAVVRMDPGLKPKPPAPDLMSRILVFGRPGSFGVLIERAGRVLAPGEWTLVREAGTAEAGGTARRGEPDGTRYAKTDEGIARIVDPGHLAGPGTHFLAPAAGTPASGGDEEP